ncbi:MAG: hypothetical protein HYV09_03130 [Deltaproteobacteria bacterium]|nr:hypothetical protein [Deltaproteobacteria bacterium]
MGRESRRAAILALAAGAFGVGLVGYTIASAELQAKEVPASGEPTAEPQSKGGGPEGTSEPSFTRKGSVDYFCRPHCDVGMKGMITVE